MFRNYLIIIYFFFLTSSNTVIGSIEGTALGAAKDIKTTHHYTTCVFTKTQCGDIDLN